MEYMGLGPQSTLRIDVHFNNREKKTVIMSEVGFKLRATVLLLKSFWLHTALRLLLDA